MKQYHDALKHILDSGELVTDRTNVGTLSLFGLQMRFNLQDGFPAVTTKKLAWKAVVGELLWFLEGSTDERRLAEITFEKSRKELVGKNTIWTANANKQGIELGYPNNDHCKELGPIYSKQWRGFGGVDQIEWIIDEIEHNPDSRRIILSAWNPPEISSMSLPPCHTLCQFRVYNGKLNCQLYQRSADFGLGVPFNIASYSLLTYMLAQICILEVGEFIWTGGDCHIYVDHIDAIKEQLTRVPYDLPTLVMPKFYSLEQLLKTRTSDYVLENYVCHEAIKMSMAV